MPPQFYSPYDQSVYDSGFQYIPQRRYLLNDFDLPAGEGDGDSNLTQPVSGIAAVNLGGDGFNPYNTNMSNIRQDYDPFPSRQAGEIYSKTFNPQPFTDPNQLGVRNSQIMYNKAAADLADPFNRLALTETLTTMRPSKEVMDFYGEKILDNQEKYRTQGQYIDPYDPEYSSMIEAQKFMDNYPDYYGVSSGVPEEGLLGLAQNYVQNSLLGKGVGMVTDFLGRVMPINQRAIMENEARGANIFTDDIGRIVTDDYNTAGGIMAGYNLNKIDADTFQKRRDTINAKMSDKINPETGKTFKQERLDLLDEAEDEILGSRKRTAEIIKLRNAKKLMDSKTIQNIPDTGDDKGTTGIDTGKGDNSIDTKDTGGKKDTGKSTGGTNPYGGGPEGVQSGMAASSPTNVGNPFGYMSGGRVYYMDGGLADLVDIYD